MWPSHAPSTVVLRTFSDRSTLGGSGRPAGSPSRRPGPGEVVAADGSKGIEHFATKIQPRHLLALKGFRIDRSEGDATARYFRLLVALVAGPGQRIRRQQIDQRDTFGALQAARAAIVWKAGFAHQLFA